MYITVSMLLNLCGFTITSSQILYNLINGLNPFKLIWSTTTHPNIKVCDVTISSHSPSKREHSFSNGNKNVPGMVKGVGIYSSYRTWTPT